MTETVRPGGRPVDDQSIGELVATMSRDLSVLVNKEIELAKAEITEDIKRAGLGAGFLGGGGFLAYFGALFARWPRRSASTASASGSVGASSSWPGRTSCWPGACRGRAAELSARSAHRAGP